MTPRRRVHAVGLVEIADAADPLEDKRNKRCMVFFRQRSKDRFKFAVIVPSHIGRHLHAGDDDFRAGIFLLDPVDNGLEILAGALNRKTAQAVIGAELKNQNSDAIAHKPIDSTEAAGTGIAALAGVDDFEGPAFGIDLFLNQGGIRLGKLDAVSGCNTVAKK